MAKPDSLWKGRGDDYCSGSDGHVSLWGGRGSGDCSGGGDGPSPGGLSLTGVLTVAAYDEYTWGYQLNHYGALHPNYAGGVGRIETVRWSSYPWEDSVRVSVWVYPSELSDSIRTVRLIIPAVGVDVLIPRERLSGTFFADFPREQVAGLPETGDYPITLTFVE